MNSDTSAVFRLRRGTAPLLISMPHIGTIVPAEVQPQLALASASLADTDWHLDRLYDFAEGLGATVLHATISRYVIDLNRPADDESLYPGQTTTGLCPGETFRGEALYPGGTVVDPTEKARRLEAYWKPYHQTLREELERLVALHGAVLLWDAHSIASVLPRLFEGKLPDLNFGTSDGRTCDPAIIDSVLAAAQRFLFTSVLNGRFKGGHITRHYGAPLAGVHAIQLEMCQCLYMEESAPFEYLQDVAEWVQPAVRAMLEAGLEQIKKLSTR